MLRILERTGRKVLTIGLLAGLSACSGLWLGPEPKAGSPEAVYDEFWNAFDRNYIGFEVRRVNWDSVYAATRPQVTAATTEKQLLALMGQNIRAFRDNHVFVKAGPVGSVGSFTIVANQNFPGLNELKNRYVPTLTFLNSQLAYATIRPLVGYIYIGTFVNNSGFAALDRVLTDMQDYKALIIDIRDNNGGNDANGYAIAIRLNTQPRPYVSIQYRTGPRHTDLSAPEVFNLGTQGDKPFTKPIYLLTNRHVFSAGNGFTLMMRALPNVVQIGDTTGDGVAGPTLRELSNGWQVAISSKLESMTNGQAVEGVGIAPTIRVLNGPDDVAAGRDRILETALEMVR